MIYYIYNGDELLGFIYNSNTYYYHKNIFGDIIGILDSNYNEVVTYTYNSWGLLTNKTDTTTINLSTINPFRYRSYYYDEETNLYYLNSRYYNPEWGRFVNADSFLGINDNHTGYNLFAYVDNNPINNFDDNGHFLKKVKSFFKKASKSAASIVKKTIVTSVVKIKKKVTQVKEAIKPIINTAKKIISGKKTFVFEGKVGLGAEVNMKVANKSISNIGFDKSIGYDNQRGYYTTSTIGATMFDFGISGEVRNYDNGYGNPMAMPWEIWNSSNTVKSYTFGVSSDIIENDVGLTNSSKIETSSDTLFIGVEFGIYIFGGFNIKIGYNIE